MKIQEILEQYSDSALDKIAADKVDESVNLRLPRVVIIQEIAEALNSLTYVAKVLAPSRPPTYAFLKLLLEEPGYLHPVEGFQEKILNETKDMSEKAESGQGLLKDKNYPLYLKVLKAAWEDDVLERSEALLLQALREELGIWTREHLLLEHHPDVIQVSDFSSAYISARNHLLATGLVLLTENDYVMAEEVALQVRRAWGIDLQNSSYSRLLNAMTKKQLHNILEKTGLQVAGSKEEQIQRIINALVPPGETLDFLNIAELRDLSRSTKAPVAGIKVEVIVNLIEHFDQDRDLEIQQTEEPEKTLPEVAEGRELDDAMFEKLLLNLSNDNLYDILSASFLPTSGTKDVKINRLVESPWSERTILNRLRRLELSNLCRKLGVQVSGVKGEIIDRLLNWGAETKADDLEDQPEFKPEKDQISPPDVKTLSIPDRKPAAIPGFDDIKRTFPELEHAEQVILSLIGETKSLTEQDIERVSQHHGFEWFLTKAHMAELMAKLKESGNLPIRVKSARNVNIYEWIGLKRQGQGEIEKHAGRDVINALRQGVVPEKHLDLLMVGQENARQHLIELLDEIHSGKSAFKFIRGPYGAGKTFLCSWLRQYALDNEYVVSLVNIGPDQPLSDLPVFFSGIVNGLRTPEKRDSSALTDVLESWLLTIHRNTAQIEGLNAFDSSTRDQLRKLVEERIESELAAIANIESCFSPALRTFYRAKLMEDRATSSSAVAWLSGSRSMPTKTLTEIGVRGYLEANQVFRRMRALLKIIAGSRFKGLLLMVDELELIRKFPHARQREQALETLRLLIDETGINGFPGCLLVFTGTDTFFEDDRAGLKSYEALFDRVSVPDGLNGMVSVRQPVIGLEGLNQERLNSVAKKIRDIHGIAYDWNASQYVPDDFLLRQVTEWTAFGNGSITRKPRPVLRELIHILDICEENPGVDLNEFFGISMDHTAESRAIEDILSE